MPEIFETQDTLRDTSNFERGKVERQYVKGASLEYPCVVMSIDTMSSHFKKLFSGIIVQKNMLTDESTEGLYMLYLQVGGNKKVGIGYIRSTSFKMLFTSPAYASWDKYVMLDKDTRVEGDMLLALCRI